MVRVLRFAYNRPRPAVPTFFSSKRPEIVVRHSSNAARNETQSVAILAGRSPALRFTPPNPPPPVFPTFAKFENVAEASTD